MSVEQLLLIDALRLNVPFNSWAGFLVYDSLLKENSNYCSMWSALVNEMNWVFQCLQKIYTT